MKTERMLYKKILKITGLSIFSLLIIIYAFFRSHDLIFGVKITNVKIDNLPDPSGKKMYHDIIEITGQAKNAVYLSLNGREISIDEDNNFEETIALLSGYNIVTIKARDRFGYVDEKNYQLIY